MRFAWIVALTIAAPAAAQRLPESIEPPLADPDSGVRQVGTVAPAGPPNAPVPPSAVPIVAVRIEAPKVAPLGLNVEYKLHVENRSAAPAHNVVLTGELSPGSRVVKADPAAQSDSAKLVWSFGTLPAGGRKTIALYVAAADGAKDVNLSAVVQFTHGQSTRTQLARPTLTLKAIVPPKVQQFDIVSLRFELANSGELPVDEIQVNCPLPDGLIHFDPTAVRPIDPRRRSWPVGRLAPGQVRVIDFYVQAKQTGSIPFTGEVIGANGVKTAAGGTVVVEPPVLELTAKAPSHRTAHQAATVAIVVKNAGPSPLRNVVVTDQLPAGVRVESVGGGGLEHEGVVQWILPMLAPGTSTTLELTTRSPVGGRAEHKISAAYRDLRREATAVTQFEAVPEITWNFQGRPAAVAVGETVTYRAQLTNNGSAAAANLRLTVTLPPGLEFVNGTPGSPTVNGPTVVFPPHPLPPGETLELMVTARAAKPVGRVSIAAELAADGLPGSPLRRGEPTTVVAP